MSNNEKFLFAIYIKISNKNNIVVHHFIFKIIKCKKTIHKFIQCKYIIKITYRRFGRIPIRVIIDCSQSKDEG